MKEEGFSVTNTSGEDLDKNQRIFIRKTRCCYRF
jgi:hypothetical protein